METETLYDRLIRICEDRGLPARNKSIQEVTGLSSGRVSQIKAGDPNVSISEEAMAKLTDLGYSRRWIKFGTGHMRAVPGDRQSGLQDMELANIQRMVDALAENNRKMLEAIQSAIDRLQDRTGEAPAGGLPGEPEQQLPDFNRENTNGSEQRKPHQG